MSGSPQSDDRWTWPALPFFFGANLPWIDYGCDVGANAWYPEGGIGARPAALARLEEVLERLAADRVSIVRMFLLCDLRSGVRFDTDGTPVELDAAVFRDADVILNAAAARSIRLMPVLFDFYLCKAAEVVDSVQIGGRGALVADPEKRGRLLSAVVQPLVERYGQHPAIAAWDLFNEPEWCTRRLSPVGMGRVMTSARMRQCLGQMADCVHASARQPVTIGLAKASNLDLVRGLGLDFYQVHWYGRFGWEALADPVDRFALDRPILLGEFPGRGAAAAPAAIVSAARGAGYAGALIWSVMACDSASEYVDGLVGGD